MPPGSALRLFDGALCGRKAQMGPAKVTSGTTWNRRGFWALILTQFQGAFNDNLYRWIITYHLFDIYINPKTGLPDSAKASTVAALGAILFSAPYILFPGIAGALADRYSKRSVTIATKLWEVMVMSLGLVAFMLNIEPLIWTMFFLMSMQSAFFSPAKYGILPEMLPESRLSWGNGVLNMASFVAIVMGMACAGLLFKWEMTIYTMSGILICLSLMGLACSLFVTRLPAADPERRVPVNPWAGLGRSFRLFFTDHILFLMMLASSFFWFAGALIQQTVPVHGRVTLGLDTFYVSLMVAFVGTGIGSGSFAAGYLSRQKIELGLVPMGMAGIVVLALLLAIPGAGYVTLLALLLLIGFSAGFYVVPVYAMIQHRSPKGLKGGMIATLNVVDCIGILTAGALFMAGGTLLKTSSYHFFLITAVLTLALGTYLCVAFPTFVLRSGLWILANTLYRLRVKGAENVPEEGGALLVANHTSCVDALVLVASIDRPVRFVMAEPLFAAPGLSVLSKVLGIRPHRARGELGPASHAAHLTAAAEALEAGEVVCIFSEGLVTPSGEILPFREALERIMNEADAPVIPVFVDPLLGNVFEVIEERMAWKLPSRLPYPIAVSFGAPLPPDTSVSAVIAGIQEAGTQAYSERLWAQPLLHRAFIRTARRHLRLMSLADARTPPLSFFKTLVGSVILGRKLRELLDDQPVVGVLVPPSVGGALANVALQIMGRVPVNLNYTASAETMAAAARQSGLTHVITAHAVLEKLPLQVPGKAVYLEDIMASVTKKDRLTAIPMALFAPVRWLERWLGSPPNRSEQDLATIIFSSGSEGEPKGVMLTHYGILSNIDGSIKIFPHKTGDRMMGILPFFHSFGFTTMLWLPLIEALGVVYHPNPLEARIVGQLIKKYQAWFFLATSTFLQNFIRRCPPEDLSSLGCVVCGAEKLASRVRDAFTEKFGVEPLEGYGVTECSPTVSVNRYDFRASGVYQRGTKRGTIGRPLPGIAMRVIDTDSGEPLPPNKPGLLMVKGPNVMKGYLGMPQRTTAVLRDGWYETGDIAAIDEDGFITITDRLARFSKIAGEMVPHIRVEEALHELLGLTEQSLAVAAVPDASRGERLVVLHTLDDEQLEALLGKLGQSGLPNLWRPRPNAFYRINEIPVLGTGKMDIKAVKNLARKLDIGD